MIPRPIKLPNRQPAGGAVREASGPATGAVSTSFFVAMLVLALLVPTGCGTPPQPCPGVPAAEGVGAVRPESPADPNFHPGDRLLVYFQLLSPPQPDVKLEATVEGRGTIALLSNRVFTASGKSRDSLEQEVHDYYTARVFRAMKVSIFRASPRFYRVRGEVRCPGIKPFEPKTVLEAIQDAGGFTGAASRRRVSVIRGESTNKIDCIKAGRDAALDMKVEPEDKIVVPAKFLGLF